MLISKKISILSQGPISAQKVANGMFSTSWEIKCRTDRARRRLKIQSYVGKGKTDGKVSDLTMTVCKAATVVQL